jgi:hypothetical protein
MKFLKHQLIFISTNHPEREEEMDKNDVDDENNDERAFKH